GIAGDVEDEDLAVGKAGGPELAAVVSEAAMMRFVLAADRSRTDHLAESRRAFAHVDGDKLVRAVAHPIDAESPDVDEILIARNSRHIRRLAGLVGDGPHACARREREKCDTSEKHIDAAESRERSHVRLPAAAAPCLRRR